MDVSVHKIKKHEVDEWLMQKHYLKRMPSISWAFGLYVDRELEGVLTIGKPASNSLCEGVCGKKMRDYVYELNRVVINEGLGLKNLPSRLISGAIKALRPQRLILVSYADTAWGHHGFIYQATNWIYTGVSAKRKDRDAGGVHQRHKFDKSAPMVDRSTKHRYVMFVGDKRFKRECMVSLRYGTEEYPKGHNRRYDASYAPVTQKTLFIQP